jgi:hypothetical protein
MLFRRFAPYLALSFTITSCNTARAGQGVTLSTPRAQMRAYEKLELAIEVGREYQRPFDPCEVELNVLVTTPGGRMLTLPAFYGQDYERQDLRQGSRMVAWYYPQGTASWKARFAPTEAGVYGARAVLKDKLGEVSSAPVEFTCVESARKGFLRAGRADPRFLEFTTGEPFFAIGQNVAFVGEGQYVTPVKAEEVFARLADSGANFVRVWTCCQDWALAIEAQKSAWTRSWTRETPIVPVPDAEGDPNARQCVRIKGDAGASLTASPSHPVGLRPATRYVIAGKFKAEGCQALRLQVGGNNWEIPAQPRPSSDWQTFRQEFVTGPEERWLGRVAFSLVGAGTTFLSRKRPAARSCSGKRMSIAPPAAITIRSTASCWISLSSAPSGTVSTSWSAPSRGTFT